MIIYREMQSIQNSTICIIGFFEKLLNGIHAIIWKLHSAHSHRTFLVKLDMIVYLFNNLS